MAERDFVVAVKPNKIRLTESANVVLVKGGPTVKSITDVTAFGV